MDYKTIIPEAKVITKRKKVEGETSKNAKRVAKTIAHRETNRKEFQKKRRDQRINVDKAIYDTEKEVPNNKQFTKMPSEKEDEKLPKNSSTIQSPIIKKMFKQIGKDATEHFLQNVVGDGACGFRCIALHCCHNEADFKRI